MWLLLVTLAAAAPLRDGERLEFAVRWMGIEAGSAWSTLTAAAEGWVVEAGAKNAGWLDGLYPIDDWMRSEWRPGEGSRRYLTRFREGRFHQDQEMWIGPPEVRVRRSQAHADGWRSSEGRYAWVPGAEDPLSAIYRLRVDPPPVGGTTEFPVFNGKRTLRLRASAEPGPTVGEVPTRRLVLRSAREGDYDGGIDLLVSEDADRVPMEAVIATRAGPVKVALVRRTVPPR